MRELRHLAERILEPVLVQLCCAVWNMDSVFEQTRGIRLDSATVGGGLAGELGPNLGPDVKRDGHVGPSRAGTLLPCRPDARPGQPNTYDRPLLCAQTDLLRQLAVK